MPIKLREKTILNKSSNLFAVLFASTLLFLVACGSTEESADTAGSGRSPTHKNVILIIIDALRPDHLSCYGYHRFTSPSLDSLAAGGTVWLNARSQAPWTLPSHATIWTGTTPRTHMTRADAAWQNTGGPRLNYALDPELPSLPVILSEEGFATCGIANVILLSEKFGFDEGFHSYSCAEADQGGAEVSVDSLIQWIDNNGSSRFFCMLHLFDVHDPYDPPGVYGELFGSGSTSQAVTWEVKDDSLMNPQDRDHLMANYDGEIAWVDYNLSRLFRRLRETGLSDSTLIVVTSDHGEEFLDNGWILHGSSLHRELLHVPLIMSGPGIEEGLVVEETPVGLMDLMPTLLAWTGIPCPESVQGIDILGGDIPSGRMLPASGVAFYRPDSLPQLASVRVGDIKTIGYENLEYFQSYDLSRAPEEVRPMEPDSIYVEMVLQYWASPQLGDPDLVDSDESESRLRDLGYID